MNKDKEALSFLTEISQFFTKKIHEVCPLPLNNPSENWINDSGAKYYVKRIPLMQFKIK